MATQLIISGVTDELNRRLAKLGKTSGQSIDAVALGILQAAVDPEAKRERLTRYMTWSNADLVEFDVALKGQRVIDQNLWR